MHVCVCKREREGDRITVIVCETVCVFIFGGSVRRRRRGATEDRWEEGWGRFGV